MASDVFCVMSAVLILPSEAKENMQVMCAVLIVPSEKEEGEYGKSCLLC